MTGVLVIHPRIYQECPNLIYKNRSTSKSRFAWCNKNKTYIRDCAMCAEGWNK